MGVLSGLGLKGAQYTGLSSLASVADLAKGKLPLLGVTDNFKVGALRDLEKLYEGDLLGAVAYNDR